MAASSSDHFRSATSSGRPENAYLLGAKTVGSTTVSLSTTTGWATDTGTDFIMFRKDASNEMIAGTLTTWTGTVSGANINDMILRAGTEPVDGYPAGEQSVVIATPTAAWNKSLIDGILVEHSQTGVHKLTQLVDTNGNETIKFGSTASAVNEVTVTNAITATGPTIAATGGDANIDLNLTGKGTGKVKLPAANKTIDANGWSVTDLGFCQEYHKRVTFSASKVVDEYFQMAATALPVGIASIGTNYVAAFPSCAFIDDLQHGMKVSSTAATTLDYRARSRAIATYAGWVDFYVRTA